MNTEAVLLAVWSVFFISLFATSIWRGWAHDVYEKSKDSRWTWYWLDLFGVPRTRDNCVRFLNGCSWAGIGLLVVGTIVTFILKW